MPFDLDLIAQTPDLRALPTAQARIAIATRVAVVFAKLERDPHPELEQRLGTMEAAVRFLNLMKEIGVAWPDPVYVNAPCCPRLSYDEMMVLDLISAAGESDREAFDSFLCEMIPAGERERIYRACERFVEVYRRRKIAGEAEHRP